MMMMMMVMMMMIVKTTINIRIFICCKAPGTIYWSCAQYKYYLTII